MQSEFKLPKCRTSLNINLYLYLQFDKCCQHVKHAFGQYTKFKIYGRKGYTSYTHISDVIKYVTESSAFHCIAQTVLPVKYSKSYA